MRCAVCLFVKNEARYIREWIAYHKAIGFDHFLIYDNGSTDETVREALMMGSVAGINIVPWGHEISSDSQLNCYRDCLLRFNGRFDWIAFIDSDEFIASPRDERIQSLLARCQNAEGIALNWAFFGANGHSDVPSGLLIAEFDHRSVESFEPNRHTKMIVRPECVTAVVNPHCFSVDGRVVCPNGESVDWESPGVTRGIDWSSWKVNHFFVRSYRQWLQKIARGYRDITRTEDIFHVYNKNDVEDVSSKQLVAPVTSMLESVSDVRQFHFDKNEEIVCVIDVASTRQLVGWATQPSFPNLPVKLFARIDGCIKTEIFCNVPRLDVRKLRKQPGLLGFYCAIDVSGGEEQAHELELLDERGEVVVMLSDGIPLRSITLRSGL